MDIYIWILFIRTVSSRHASANCNFVCESFFFSLYLFFKHYTSCAVTQRTRANSFAIRILSNKLYRMICIWVLPSLSLPMIVIGAQHNTKTQWKIYIFIVLYFVVMPFRGYNEKGGAAHCSVRSPEFSILSISHNNTISQWISIRCWPNEGIPELFYSSSFHSPQNNNNKNRKTGNKNTWKY